MSRADLKQKVEGDLFTTDGRKKKMKPSTEVYQPALENPCLEGIKRYTSIAHNEVLRVAATGGLLNPVHFDVTKTGTIAITKLGLEKAALYTKHVSKPVLIENWESEKAAEMSQLVRRLMDKGGFFDCGHVSVQRLSFGLRFDRIMESKALIEALHNVNKKTLPVRLKLKECYDDLKITMKDEWTPENSAKLKPLLLSLYHTEQNELSFETKYRLSDTQSGIPRMMLIEHISMILNNYHSLISAANTVKKNSRIPDHHLAPCAPRPVLEDEENWAPEVRVRVRFSDDAK
ncbi:hypothetical protein B0J13DRAFT_633082 [Dactylonectria estremocensis]|uniref:Uncharacterized protein n=1 Tax=Dactylonectria estremocensis TaxID=1079267 RepID=A0A9P9FIM6_9HYPO|nr:hypothetical protein B0J13DRAFT_633082 [Dactylonectria estremocensis]